MSTPEAVLAEGWFAADEVTPLGAGHIHDTYRATARDGGRFVLQRINGRVFSDPVQVMRNVLRVTAHLSTHAPGLVPGLIRTRSGAGFHEDESGHLWRLWAEVLGTRIVSEVNQTAVAEAAGFAFGRFLRVLEDLPEPPLTPVIPGFHELDKALQRLDRAAPGVRGDWEQDAACVDAHRKLAQQRSGRLRPIHGDCKLNNLLFDATRPEVRSVLDLDTVMIGHWAWDFGDLARSLLNATRRGLQPQAFAALTRGFLASSGIRATAAELVEAPGYMTFMLGVRYLTDHFEGDTYFKVAARGDNLRRARRQFALLESIKTDTAALTDALQRIDGVVD